MNCLDNKKHIPVDRVYLREIEELGMIDRYFTEHPRSIGESYFEHLRTAAWFGATMIIAGFACLVHALVPGVFVKTGSAAIERLHDRMIVNRNRQWPITCPDDQSGRTPRSVSVIE
jgi:hypothetical protein